MESFQRASGFPILRYSEHCQGKHQVVLAFLWSALGLPFVSEDLRDSDAVVPETSVHPRVLVASKVSHQS